MSDVTNSMTLAEMEAYWVSVGEKKAEQRIIKLLKERYADYVGIDNWADAAEIDEVIALINGENK